MGINFSRFKNIDGISFYNAFQAGSYRVLEKEHLLNEINVFPVPDGDTGTNLVFTLRHIIEDTTPEKSFSNTATSISKAALEGARGNSGIIFAQFLYGFSYGLRNQQFIDVKEFVKMVNRGIRFAVQAIDKPVEGTIITVISEWAEHINNLKGKIDDFFRLFSNSIKTAQESLRQTPQKLAILKKNNVVDAGAQGFVFFLEGILEFLKKGKIRKTRVSFHKKIEKIQEPTHLEPSTYRFCVESIIEGNALTARQLHNQLHPLGDSLVIAGGGDYMRIHMHTNNPAEFFFLLQSRGRLRDQKVDDMAQQYNIRYHRKWSIALVTDSVCDLPEKLMDFYQIHMIPIRLQFGDNTFFDKVTLTPHRFYTMMAESRNHPTTSHPGIRDFERLYSSLLSQYDSVIALHMSKQLSGTWNTSRQAAEKLCTKTGKRISVIDSRNLSGSLGLLVLDTAESISRGLNHDQLLTQITQSLDRACILVSVKNLTNMVKGGRVSPMKGMIANVLNLKPIVSLDPTGKSILYDKAFSQKGNIKKVLAIIKRRLEKTPEARYCLLHAHDPKGAEDFARQLCPLLGKEPEYTVDISPAVGLSAGHGAVAVALLFDPKAKETQSCKK